MAEIPLDVTWSDVDLQDFIPTDIIALIDDVLAPITDFVSSSASILKAEMQLLQALSGSILPAVDPVLAGISASVTALQTLINDLNNTGGQLLLIPPQPGGLTQFGNFIRLALNNPRLQESPNLTDTAFSAGFGALAFAPDLATTRIFFDDLAGSVTVEENIQRKLGVEAFVQTAKFNSHTTKFKVAQSATPQPDTPWTGVSAGKLIPKSEEVVQEINSYLSAINTQIATDPFDDFVNLTDQVIANTTVLADDLNETAEFIENAFPELPIKHFVFEPQEGGNNAISESTKDWFDKRNHEELEDVPDKSFVTGYFITYGRADLSAVQTIHDVWVSLFLP